jgi:hypothetical protein
MRDYGGERLRFDDVYYMIHTFLRQEMRKLMSNDSPPLRSFTRREWQGVCGGAAACCRGASVDRCRSIPVQLQCDRTADPNPNAAEGGVAVPPAVGHAG